MTALQSLSSQHFAFMCERLVMQATMLVFCCFSCSLKTNKMPYQFCSPHLWAHKGSKVHQELSQQPIWPLRLNNHWGMCFYVKFNYKQILTLLHLTPRKILVYYYPILHILHLLIDATLNLVWSTQVILPRIIQRHCKTVLKTTSTTITFTYY